MNVISVAYHIYLSTYIKFRMNYGIEHSNLSNDMINNNARNKQCMIVSNHLYDKLLRYLLQSNWQYRHDASVCLRILLTDVIINGFTDANCDNISIEGNFIYFIVSSLDRLFYFQSDILEQHMYATSMQYFTLFVALLCNIILNANNCVKKMEGCSYLKFKL